MKILVLNGPNLNLLGDREPEIYGRVTLPEIIERLENIADVQSGEIDAFQSNHEGELIDKLHAVRKWVDGIVMNPGAFTHYSYALRDAIAAVGVPTVEVHLSDIENRESFRRTNVFEGLPNVQRITGQGAKGYEDALLLLLAHHLDH